MQIQFDNDRPIYIQLAEGIEDAILSGAFAEEEQIPSTTEISVTFKINPATALKGIKLLVDEGALYKKRGVGMFVATGSVKEIIMKRKESFFDTYISKLVSEAEKLHVTKSEIISMIERGFDNE
ncbi:GntR family transcriptional regulator [Bacillus sp. 1P06AnD]|uniref:GntR family transcriptional regulator n=1 Tax=Bacillus sp. 1P06AnD TaxID=3132208 RepID=UPI0039A3C89C